MLKHSTPDVITRLEFLVAQKLHKINDVMRCAPREIVHEGTQIGHYSNFCSGKNFEDILSASDADYTLTERMTFAIAFAHALDTLHQKGLGHGDLNSQNVFGEVVSVSNGAKLIKAYLIDFDNFFEENAPLQPCLGQQLYMAPELYSAYKNKRTDVIADIATDLYALGILIHEILLFKHVTSGCGEGIDSFEEVLEQGKWIHDPIMKQEVEVDGGYPATILDPDISSLFRRAVSLTPSERPSASEWRESLLYASKNIFICDNKKCHGDFINFVSRKYCPYCKKPFPSLALKIEKKTIPLNGASVVIGRDKIRGSAHVSSKHAVFRKVGAETTLESLGQNGTFRKIHGKWTRLAQKKSVSIEAGDKVKFADVEGKIILL